MFEHSILYKHKNTINSKNTPTNKIPPKKTIRRSDLCARRLGRLAKVVDFDDVGGEALVRLMWREISFGRPDICLKKKTMDFSQEQQAFKKGGLMSKGEKSLQMFIFRKCLSSE